MPFVCAGLSMLLLAAHYLRSGALLLVLACLALPALALSVRRRWSLRLLQAGLLLGALVWLGTAFGLLRERRAEGRPWLRMACILGGVAAFSAFSARLLERPSVLARHP